MRYRALLTFVAVVALMACPPAEVARREPFPGTPIAVHTIHEARLDGMFAADEAARQKPPPTPEQIYPAALYSAQLAIRAADEVALDTPGVDCVQWVRAHGGTIARVEDFRAERPRRARQRCTVDDPVELGAQVGQLRYDHDQMLMSCDLARTVVQLSELLAERGVVEVEVSRPYSCRTIRRRRTLSQHAHGLAIDIGSFTDRNGRVYSIRDHWEHDTETPVTEEGQWLWRVFRDIVAAELFNIILTPNYDAAHDRWMHLDRSPGNRFVQ